jgi:hypothetical protein
VDASFFAEIFGLSNLDVRAACDSWSREGVDLSRVRVRVHPDASGVDHLSFCSEVGQGSTPLVRSLTDARLTCDCASSLHNLNGEGAHPRDQDLIAALAALSNAAQHLDSLEADLSTLTEHPPLSAFSDLFQRRIRVLSSLDDDALKPGLHELEVLRESTLLRLSSASTRLESAAARSDLMAQAATLALTKAQELVKEDLASLLSAPTLTSPELLASPVLVVVSDHTRSGDDSDLTDLLLAIAAVGPSAFVVPRVVASTLVAAYRVQHALALETQDTPHVVETALSILSSAGCTLTEALTSARALEAS